MQKIGLVLSGGGARGFAHIGVLKALAEAGIQPEIVAGTSAGAIVGSMLAAGKTPDEMYDFVDNVSFIRSIRLAPPWRSAFSLAPLGKKLQKFLGIQNFEDLQLPFSVTVSNIESGDLEVINSGKLIPAVIASSSVPLVFTPVKINETLYLDGGVMMNLPAEVIRDQVDFLIGVNLHPQVPLPQSKVNGVLGIGFRNFDLVLHGNTRESRKLCDYLIAPKTVVKHHIFRFWKWKEIYEIGYQEGKKAASELKKLL